MATLVDAEQAILARFLANWTGTAASRVLFQNEGSSAVDSVLSPWVRLSIVELSSQQQTLGAVGTRKFRRVCQVAVQVMVPVNAGARLAKQLAEQVRTVFEGQQFNELYFYDASVSPSVPEQKWLVTTVRTRFEFWDTK